LELIGNSSVEIEEVDLNESTPCRYLQNQVLVVWEEVQALQCRDVRQRHRVLPALWQACVLLQEVKNGGEKA